MKRCSQCDFIYEDDQHLCDMDGHELVYEPTLQSLQIIPATAAIKLPARPVKSRGRRLAFVAAAAVLIGTVLSVGYSGFTSEYAPQNTKAPATNFIRPPQSVPDQTPATPAVSPTPYPSHSPRLEKTRMRPPTASPIASSIPRYRSSTARREIVRSETAKANHKKESRIGGFLKKTGRILKRPFKL
jgi:hypothetical protein